MDERPISKHPIEKKPLNATGFLKIHWLIVGAQ